MYYDTLRNILTSPLVDSLIAGYAYQIVWKVAMPLAVFLFFITFGINYLVTTLKGGDKGQFLNKFEIFRGVILIFLIGIYPLLMQGIVGMAEIVNKGTAVTNSDLLAYEEFLDVNYKSSTLGTAKLTEADKKNMKENNYNIDNMDNNQTDSQLNTAPVKAPDDGPVKPDGTKPGWTSLFDLVSNPAAVIGMIIDFVALGIVSIIRIVISIVLIYVIKVLYVVGSLSFAFSMLPFMRDKCAEWLNTFINCLFVFTTMNILDFLVIQNINGRIQDLAHSEGGNSFIGRTALDIAIIILYIMCFWLTGKYVGNDSAGKIFSQALDSASRMAQASMSGGATGGGDLLKSGTAGNVADTAKDAISKS